jgi:hypothetical protein
MQPAVEIWYALGQPLTRRQRMFVAFLIMG